MACLVFISNIIRYRLFEFDLFCLTRFEGIRNTFSELEVEAFIANKG